MLTITATPGSVLQAGNEVIEIGDPSRVWIEAEVSEDEAVEITRGQRALVRSLRAGRSTFATVETLAAQVDPGTRRRRVFLNPCGDTVQWLTPGILVETCLAEPDEQLVLPVEAVLIKEGERDSLGGRKVVFPHGYESPISALIERP